MRKLPRNGAPQNTADCAVIAYVAEWYKRVYTPDNRSGYTSVVRITDVEALMTLAGIDAAKFLYPGAQAIYCLFVLGGLPLAQTRLRTSDAFLKRLCRLRRGEDVNLSTSDDSARSVAYRQSIRLNASIGTLFAEILNGNDEFLSDDPDLAVRLREIDNSLQPAKFSFEWRYAERSDGSLQRNLRVRMLPESGNRESDPTVMPSIWLLRWGICADDTEIRRTASVKLAPRFKYKGDVVRTADFASRDVLTLKNSNGKPSVFIADVMNPWKDCRQTVPQCEIDEVELLAFANGKTVVVQSEKVVVPCQLWRDYATDGMTVEWSTNEHLHQRATSVLAPTEYEVVDSQSSPAPITRTVTLRSSHDIGSVNVSWIRFNVDVAITTRNAEDPIFTFYSRRGINKPFAPIRSDLFASDMTHIETDDADEPEEEDMPFVFAPSDFVLRHEEGDRISQYRFDLIEFKKDDGRYVEWNADAVPPFGPNTFRLVWRGKEYSGFRAAVLPSIDASNPVVRDCESNQISFRGTDGFEEVIDVPDMTRPGDEIPPCAIACRYEIGDGVSATVQILRPWNLGILSANGRVVALDAKRELSFPYIAKDELCADIWSAQGFTHYDCSELRTYPSLFGNARNAVLGAWEQDDSRRFANFVNLNAPKDLAITLGEGVDCARPEGDDVIFWDYVNPPCESSWSRPLTDSSILFLSRRKECNLLRNPYPREGRSVQDRNPFRRRTTPVVRRELDWIAWFELALEHRVCFVMFRPFSDKIANGGAAVVREKLVAPLREKRGGELTDADYAGLMRLADEFSISFNDFIR